MLPPTLIRRLVLAPLVIVISVGFIMLSPGLALLALVSGLITRSKAGHMRSLRLVGFALTWFVAEPLALVALTGLWVASGFGGRLRTEPYQARHYAVMRRFLDTLYDGAARTYGLRVDDIAKNVQSQIDDARQQAGLPAAAAVATEKPEAATPAPAAADAPRLTVHVSLDPKLADRVDPDATLFVFARAANGPPMPLAVQHLTAGQLPLTVTLDDSNGMLPTMKLSMFPQVVIGARISKSGNALPQSGDLQVFRLQPTFTALKQSN